MMIRGTTTFLYKNLLGLKYIIPFNKKIGYIGWLGHKNLGDEAMFYAFKKLFKKFYILPFKNNISTNKIKGLLNSDIFEAVLLGGGTLINTGFIKDLKSAQKKYKLTFIFGTGVQDFLFCDETNSHENKERDWIECINKCSYVGVRGPLSKLSLSKYGIDRAEIIGDPALFLAKANIKKKLFSKKLAINIGVPKGKNWGNEENILNFIVKLAKVLNEKRWDITFISIWDKDLPYIEEAVKRINKNNISIFYNSGNPIETINFLENFDLFIGEKLHSVILAMCAYIPSIMLEYNPKCLDFMMSMDLEKFNVRTDKLSIDLIMDMLKELQNNISIFQNSIFNKIVYFKSLQLEKSKLITNLILNK